jgi:uncharacterized membrane protein YgdD (TMEM256/DUF423 family)
MRQPVSAAAAIVAGLAGASAVAFGAFGAHALRGTLDAAALATWHTGVEYHFWHALALLVVVAGIPGGRARRIAIGSFIAGIVLFPGSLYALALGAPRFVGAITPLGGVAFIAGWLALVSALRHPRTSM